MKFTFNGYEIDLKVRSLGADKASKENALHFINTLSVLYRDSETLAKIEAITAVDEKLYKNYAEIQGNRAHELYKICEEAGLYNNLR